MSSSKGGILSVFDEDKLGIAKIWNEDPEILATNLLSGETLS